LAIGHDHVVTPVTFKSSRNSLSLGTKNAAAPSLAEVKDFATMTVRCPLAIVEE